MSTLKLAFVELFLSTFAFSPPMSDLLHVNINVEYFQFLEGNINGLNSTHSTRFLQKLNLKKLSDLKALKTTGVSTDIGSCALQAGNEHVSDFNMSKPISLFSKPNIGSQ
ncbi:Hypothetical_protein [Hexamita inflata]|uniref:Hypothetical_protein n=1 Tax=Hexamita inflata TaxID=28002 RepID=A0ABP1H4M7_9EUKA